MGMDGIWQRVGVSLFLLIVAALPLRAQFGAVDATFRPDVNGTSKTVRAMATQSDKKIVVVGDFASIDTKICKGIARYNTDGTLDMDFAKGLAGTEGSVYCVAIQSDGKIWIGGDFTAVHGVPMNRVARLNKDGTLDTTFKLGTGVNGPVYAIKAASSFFYPAAVFIGGDFTSVNGTARNNLAALDSTGSVSSYGNGMSFNGAIRAICPEYTSSSLFYTSFYIGGEFTQINSVTRNRLARLSSGFTLDNLYNSGETAGPDGPVYVLSMCSTYLLVGGDFSTFDGTVCSKIAAINTITRKLSTDLTLASADGAVHSILCSENYSGNAMTISLYLGGDFTTINGVAKGRVARMTGSVSTSYPYEASWNLDLVYAPQVNGSVYALATESDGKLIIGGAFTGVEAVTQACLARLYGVAGMAVPFTPVQPQAGAGTDTQLILNWSGVGEASGYIIERSSDGVNNWELLIKGWPSSSYIDSGLSPGSTYYYRVTAYSTNGNSAPSPVAGGTTLPVPWTQAGVLDTAFAGKTGTGLNGTGYCMTLQPDGKILVGGSFGAFNGTTCKNIVRLLSDGTIDPTFTLSTGPNSIVQAITVQADGRILIGGSFSQVGSVVRNRVARLNADGTLDPTFIVPTSGFEYDVTGIAVQSDGKVVVVGGFDAVGGVAHAGVVRLNADGALDSTFNAQLSSDCHSVAIQPDGKIVTAGVFQSANGVARGNIARFNADGSLDVNFASGSGASSWIESMQRMPDGRFVIVGPIHTYNGVTRNGVARLNSDGSLDTTFDPGAGVERGWANAVAVQPDGKVVLGGWFSSIAGKPRLYIARLNADGSLDESFQPGIGANSEVNILALQPDGKCLVGGYFTSMNGTKVNGIARLLADNGTSAPVAPTVVTAAPTSSTSMQLAWGAVAYSSGYQVYQSADGLSNWTLVDTVPGGTNSFTVTGLPVGTPRYFRVRAFSTNGEAPDSMSFFASTYTQYQQWKVDHSLSPSAPDAEDSIGKGVPHLLDYAFGGDPLTYDAPSILPSVEIPGNQMQITFWCDAARSDLTYTVQVSDDLKTWTDIAQSTGGGATGAVNGLGIVTDPATGRRQVTVTDPAAIGATDRRYLRVKVSGN